NLASDIVELVVLTGDEIFLQTLREAVGSARRLWHVPSADKVSDLLVAGGVGILVLDVQAPLDSAVVFIEQIKRQFPDLVVVVAGHRDAETWIAPLVSSGAVYRFIHKPMSPGRAKLFADAAVRKFDQQRRRAAEPSPAQRDSPANRRWLLVGSAAILAAIGAVTWMVHKRVLQEERAPHAPAARTSPAESPALAQAAAALAANRLTEPPRDNALELFLQAQARNPADPKARAGLAEVHERLLARAENALLEERLDEAALAIEAARRSGVEGARIAFLTAQLAKSREQLKAAQAQIHATGAAKAGDDKLTALLALANQRINDGHLVDPPRDSARFYVEEALRMDAASVPAEDMRRTLARRLLSEARGAVDRREFARASAWLDAAKGIAPPPNIEAVDTLLAGARQKANTDARGQLLKDAIERLQQDRLIEPPNDNAKYYLLTLRGLDPGNAGLGPAMQDLGARLVAKARRAVTLEQFDAARSWLDESNAVGFTSGEYSAVQQDLDAALAKQKFLSDVVSANNLVLVKSVHPPYPARAQSMGAEGWVELDFTVTDGGLVKDITVHAASTPGVFEGTAIKALSQWRYKPTMRDSKPVAQRARIRIRFSLSS
ncbi:MAG: TonB family protein, partial [Pseudomonadota bacterium]|nr:TonB family protein [Pseudomonadota bacterium]